MKKTLIGAALLLALHPSIISQSGWFWHSPLPNGGNFGALQFVSSNTAYGKWRVAEGKVGCL